MVMWWEVCLLVESVSNPGDRAEGGMPAQKNPSGHFSGAIRVSLRMYFGVSRGLGRYTWKQVLEVLSYFVATSPTVSESDSPCRENTSSSNSVEDVVHSKSTKKIKNKIYIGALSPA